MVTTHFSPPDVAEIQISRLPYAQRLIRVSLSFGRSFLGCNGTKAEGPLIKL